MAFANLLTAPAAFAQISKISASDESLIEFYGLVDRTHWNDTKAIKQKQEVVHALRILACQQQELLKYDDFSLEDIRFNALRHMDVLKENAKVLLYIHSRIQYNQRELFPRAKNLIDIASALDYIQACHTKVIALVKDLAECNIAPLPYMKKRDFWQELSYLQIGSTTYFPTFIGYNIHLANKLREPGTLAISLF